MRESRSAGRLQRRAFLTALGLGIAAPLALRMSRLAVAAPGARPTRLFIYYLPHGMPLEHYEPVGIGSDFQLANSGVGVLTPFEPYKKSLNVIRGVGMNGSNNHAAIRTMLTGAAEGSSGGAALDSIDAIVAKGLNVTPHVIGARPYTPGAGFSSDSYLVQHGSWVRPIEDPAAAADAYFQNIVSTPSVPGQVDEAAFRSEALALNAKEIEGMQASLSGLTHESSKLKLHLDALLALKAGGAGGVVSCTARPTLPAVEAVRGKDPLDAANFGLVVDGHLEAAAHAMVCGAARVITMQNMHVNSDLNMAFAGGPNAPQGHHDPISHSANVEGRAGFAKVQQWFYQRVADKLLATLNQPDPLDPSDATRTVLDNSLVFICSEVSDGQNHNSDASSIWVDGKEQPSHLPLMMIGGAGGYLKPQQVLDLNKRLHTDVLATIAEAMGTPVTTIGGQAVSPIAELKA